MPSVDLFFAFLLWCAFMCAIFYFQISGE